MGPSLVLSSFNVNMGDWKRGDDDGSNDEEEYDSRAHPRSTRSTTAAAARWSNPNATTTGAGVASGAVLAAAGYGSSPSAQRAPTYSRSAYDVGSSSRYASAPSAMDRAAFRTAFDSPQSYGFGGTTPNRGSKQESEGGEESEDDEEGDEDRKPAAQADLNVAPHGDQFAESPQDESPPLETMPGSDQYINPSLSFGDDEEVMRSSEGNYEIDGLGIVADPQAAMESYAASRAPSYAPPLVFQIGSNPFQQPYQVSSASVRAKGSGQPPGAPRSSQHRNMDSYRRSASPQELALNSGTDRARAAVVTWYERFNELIDYAEIHGDCNVPQKYPENPQLGIWVNKQRMEKKFMDEGKRSSMNEKRVECLESIGFVWAKRKGEASWLFKFHELQKYKETHGNCDVATKYSPNPALGRWVSTQRSEYKIHMRDGKSKHMTQQRIDMLNSLGFKWEMLQTNRTSPSNSNEGSSAGED